MSNEYEADLITLLDDDGKEHEFEIIDEIENDEGHFIALVPTLQGLIISLLSLTPTISLRLLGDEGEEQLMEVEDDETLDKLAEIFESRLMQILRR